MRYYRIYYTLYTYCFLQYLFVFNISRWITLSRTYLFITYSWFDIACQTYVIPKLLYYTIILLYITRLNYLFYNLSLIFCTILFYSIPFLSFLLSFTIWIHFPILFIYLLDVEIAKTHGKESRFRLGSAQFFDTSIYDFGELGVGIFLYFKILAVTSLLFFVLSVNILPVLYINYEGNNGYSLTNSQIDPGIGLGWVSKKHR